MNPQVLEVVLRAIHEVNQKTLSEARQDAKLEGMLEGKREGMLEGKREVREELMIEIAKAFKNQLDINELSAFTGLSIEEINSL